MELHRFNALWTNTLWTNSGVIPALLVLCLMCSGCATTQQAPAAAKIDRISPEKLAALTPPPQANLSLQEVAALCKQGKSDAEVIEAIKQSQSRYDLTAAQVLEWHQKGITTGVLDYIQQASVLAQQNAIADEMNKREQTYQENAQKLKRERDAARFYSYDPWFYGPGWGYYGRPYWGGGFGLRRFYW